MNETISEKSLLSFNYILTVVFLFEYLIECLIIPVHA